MALRRSSRAVLRALEQQTLSATLELLNVRALSSTTGGLLAYSPSTSKSIGTSTGPSLLHHLSARQEDDKQQQSGLPQSSITSYLGLQQLQSHQLLLPHQYALAGSIFAGKRHISFFRFFSDGGVSRNKKLGLPDAADAEAAIEDYKELSARLEKLQRPASIKTFGQVIIDMLVAIKNGTVMVASFLGSVPGRIAKWRAMSPEEWAEKKKSMWKSVKEEAHHFWVGTKLLGYEVRIASRHAWKAAQGKQLSRRERAQLTRTTADLFRLVPMVIIVVVPFLEFLLPVLLKIFPNMLPSTFEDKLKKEEELKRRLALRLELARFLQDTVSEMAADIARRKGSSQDVQDLYLFLEKVRAGQEVENAEIIRFARLFNDELTLDNLERLQLVGMCQFVGISPLGTDAFLRARLRQHLQQVKRDDYEIEQEGLENLTEDELRQACRARGMRAPFGEGAERFMQRQMRDWLDLSLHRGLPSSLLLLSRAFTITAKQPVPAAGDVGAVKDAQYAQLRDTLSVIPEEAVEMVAGTQLGTGTGVQALQQRLEFLKREEEAIRAELERAEAAERAAAAANTLKQGAAAAAAVGPVTTASAIMADAAATAAAGQAPSLKEAVQAATTPEAAAVALAAAGEAAAAQTPLTPETVGVAKEEVEAAAAEARERKLKQIVSALMDLATNSAVTSERKMFMELMKNEISRVNSVLAEKGKGSSTGTMTFSAKGLEVAKDTVAEEEQREADRDKEVVLPQRLSDRVTRMLASIKHELDTVESKIGRSMHLLDTDSDGKVTTNEIERAMSYLREQMPPEELQQLLSQLGLAAASNSTAKTAEAVGQAVGVQVAEGQQQQQKQQVKA